MRAAGNCVVRRYLRWLLSQRFASTNGARSTTGAANGAVSTNGAVSSRAAARAASSRRAATRASVALVATFAGAAAADAHEPAVFPAAADAAKGTALRAASPRVWQHLSGHRQHMRRAPVADDLPAPRERLRVAQSLCRLLPSGTVASSAIHARGTTAVSTGIAAATARPAPMDAAAVARAGSTAASMRQFVPRDGPDVQ